MFGEAFGCWDLDALQETVPLAVVAEWIDFWSWKNDVQNGKAGKTSGEPLDLKPDEMASLFQSSGLFVKKA